MSDLQSTLDTITRVLAECDARNLPPLTGTNAAAVLDLLDQNGLQLTEWQREFVKTVWADPDSRRQAIAGLARPTSPRLSSTDLVVATTDLPPGTQPMRGWLSRWFRRHR